ncbi:hypothetical protein Bca4012_009817 [Brassica carinata]
MIEAKVIHTWKPSQAGFGETLEIILADKKGIKVHATCRKDYLRYLGIQCIVGEWKTLILRGFLLTYSEESSSLVKTSSKRSHEDLVDIPDTTSTSKKRSMKNIKVEKMSSEELSLNKNN